MQQSKLHPSKQLWLHNNKVFHKIKQYVTKFLANDYTENHKNKAVVTPEQD